MNELGEYSLSPPRGPDCCVSTRNAVPMNIVFQFPKCIMSMGMGHEAGFCGSPGRQIHQRHARRIHVGHAHVRVILLSRDSTHREAGGQDCQRQRSATPFIHSDSLPNDSPKMEQSGNGNQILRITEERANGCGFVAALTGIAAIVSGGRLKPETAGRMAGAVMADGCGAACETAPAAKAWCEQGLGLGLPAGLW